MLTRIVDGPATNLVGENRFAIAGALGKAKLVTKLDVVGDGIGPEAD
jgi:hypothetical protein